MNAERIYLAGPMSGYPNHNTEAFERHTKLLRDKGFDVVSPVEIGNAFFGGQDPNIPAEAYLKRDLRELLTCSAIALMTGWEFSIGARCEATVALTLGLSFYDQWGLPWEPPKQIVITGG